MSSLLQVLLLSLFAIGIILWVVAWQRDLQDLALHQRQECDQLGQPVCTYSTPRLQIDCLRQHPTEPSP